ncbi:hypothetical protein, partial [Streptomyces albiaxialis]|uniref:hypothetical protein n=1 Tax=Streptomyces albiaxialis TaxID=329523 RepID=UPI0031DD4B16
RRRPRPTPGAHQAAVHANLRSCALAGWSYDQTREFADDAERSPSLEWLRTASSDTGRSPLDAAEAERRFARAWWVAVQAAARLPRRPDEAGDDWLGEAAEAAADLLARIEAAGAAHWRRPSGPADRAVLRALAWLMLTSGATEVTADVRRVAVLSGYSKSTAALALGRLLLDGWIETAKEADKAAGIARRVRLAEAHACPADAHHMCACYTPCDQEKDGSDRRRYAAPPGGVRGLLAQLGEAIVHQQAGLWHVLGHHAARTLETIQNRPGITLEDLSTCTGYTAVTTARHVAQTVTLGLVRAEEGAEGIQVSRTARTLYEAGTQVRTASRPAELAAVAAVEVAVARWWRREVEWCQASRAAKRRRGGRAHARQAVIPGVDPHARAYPRHPSAQGRPERGDADHARAFAIEAERIGAAALAVEADQLAQRGEVIDPARLGQHRPGENAMTTTAAA